MCIRCEIDDAVSDAHWDRLVQLALDLRDGRRSLDPHEEIEEADPMWLVEVDEISAWGEPRHPVAEWVARHLHVTLSPWQRRLLDHPPTRRDPR